MKKAAVLFVFFVFVFVLIFSADRLPERKKKEEKPVQDITDRITFISEKDYEPLNYKYQKAMWFTSMDYAEFLAGKTEEEFTEEAKRRFENAYMMGLNTVYVQVRAFCDAYYPSEIFPPGKYYTDTGYDPLEIMVRTAHSYGLSFHAWINPLRCVTTEEKENLSEEYSFVSEMKNAEFIKETDGRLWLDPSYEETCDIVCNGVKEILEKYRVDGIHIDDYFYPTTDESFDETEFRNSGAENLAGWRRENTCRLVKSIYETVKSENPSVLFGISPQGSIKQNMDVQYADVEKWTSVSGYCDYIVPQIYYGYENEECPFSETLSAWKDMIKSENTDLIIGLCTYKYGSEDRWAGKGADEWLNSTDIVSNQVKDITSDSKINGMAFYSYASTFEVPETSGIMLSGEMQRIREMIK